MPANKKYSNERLVQALRTSRSIRQALVSIGMAPAGGNYLTAHRLIQDLGIDTSHMLGMGWNKGNVLGLVAPNTIPLEDILVEGSTYTNTSRIKTRLIASGLKKACCEHCGLSEWNGQGISLELNHMNGDRFDHRMENLQLLCPNCHAQTETYRGKNMGNSRRRK